MMSAQHQPVQLVENLCPEYIIWLGFHIDILSTKANKNDHQQQQITHRDESDDGSSNDLEIFSAKEGKNDQQLIEYKKYPNDLSSIHLDNSGTEEGKNDMQHSYQKNKSNYSSSKSLQDSTLATLPTSSNEYAMSNENDTKGSTSSSQESEPTAKSNCSKEEKDEFCMSAVDELISPLKALEVSAPLANTSESNIKRDSTPELNSVLLPIGDDQLHPVTTARTTKVSDLPEPKFPPLSFAREVHHTHHAPSTGSGPLTINKSERALDFSPCPTPVNSPKSAAQVLNFHPKQPESNSENEFITSQLRHWTLDKDFMRHAHRREQRNPFPGICQNYGWNRAWSDVILHFSELYDGTGVNNPEMFRMAQGFKEYSLWSQLQPLKIAGADVEAWNQIFGKVFVGSEGEGTCRWVRKPGTWWGARRGLFSPFAGVHRNKAFVDWVLDSAYRISNSVHLWRVEVAKSCTRSPLKRKFRYGRQRRQMVTYDSNPIAKKRKLNKTTPTKVMSENWRARRREQEKKAGRWTDGTLRMDNMWAEFHWVLNNDEGAAWSPHWGREKYSINEGRANPGSDLWTQRSFYFFYE